jgi:hypothetical protein
MTVDRFGLGLVDYNNVADLVPSINSPFQKLDDNAAHLHLDQTFTGSNAFSSHLTVGGHLTLSGPSTLVPQGSIISWGAGSGYIMRNADPTYVQISQLTVTPGNFSCANLTVNGPAQINGALAATGQVRGATLMATNYNVYLEGSQQVLIRYRPDLGAVEIPYGNGLYTTAITASSSITASGNIGTGGAIVGGRGVFASYDVGWSLNVGGNGIASGRWFQRNNGGCYCYDVLDFQFSPSNVGNYLVQRDAAGGINIGGMNAAGAVAMASNLTVAGVLTVNGGTTLNNGATINGPSDLTMSTTSIRMANGPVISFAGGGGMSWGGNIGRPADQVYLWNTIYSYWDVDCGHHMHAQQFVQTSRGANKLDQITLTDADAMARVRDPRVGIITWRRAEPPTTTPEGREVTTFTTNDPRDVGFRAEDMNEVVPEVVTSDEDGPLAIAYGNLTALLWGAVRDLDARLAAAEARLAA